MQKKESNKLIKFFYIFTSVSILLALFWHLKAIWHQNLFGDEIHSLFFIKNNSLWSLLTKSVEPIHPNGAYILFKIIYALIPSVLALRICLFLIFLISCLILWLIIGEISKEKIVKLMGLSLWVSSAYIWHFSFQLRMYGPAFLLILLSTFTLLKNKKFLSLIMDWLLLFFAYGGILFVLAKWFAYFCLNLSKNISEKKVKSFLLYFTGISVPIVLILLNFFSKEESINNSYLYWVKIPIWQDWSLGLSSFLTGLFLPYFEGYASLNKFWLMLGFSMNILAIAILLFCIFWGWQLKNKCWLYFKKISYSERFLLLLTAVMISFYSVILIFSLIFDNHIFHIRQLFPVAIVLFLTLIYLLKEIWKRKPVFCFILIFCFLMINQLNIFKDSWKNNQAYIHHFEFLPGKPIIASSNDIELIYKQCKTFDRDEIKDRCREKSIYFVEDNTLNELKKEMWWQTRSATNNNQLDTVNCSQTSIDYYECSKSQL